MGCGAASALGRGAGHHWLQLQSCSISMSGASCAGLWLDEPDSAYSTRNGHKRTSSIWPGPFEPGHKLPTKGHKISIYQQECTSQLTQATSCRQLLKLPEIEARTAQWQLVTSKYSQPRRSAAALQPIWRLVQAAVPTKVIPATKPKVYRHQAAQLLWPTT